MKNPIKDRPLTKNEQAANAERCGYYAQAAKLWGQVVAERHKNSGLWRYALIRRDFCKSAVKNGYKRPEFRAENFELQ